MAGKQRRAQFPQQTLFRASQPLDLQALPHFKEFISLVVQETGRTVRMLRTDRGGEFNSREFHSFCADRGIRRQLTVPDTPQQNGVVERRNQTILRTVRSMLKARSLPHFLWGKVVRHTVYLKNRLPTKALPSVTPYEMWKKHKPNLTHVRVFGCLADVKTLAEKLTKFQNRSVPMVYLRSEPGSKAYRCFNPAESKVVMSRDVHFEEDKGWDWSEVEDLDEPLQYQPAPNVSPHTPLTDGAQQASSSQSVANIASDEWMDVDHQSQMSDSDQASDVQTPGQLFNEYYGLSDGDPEEYDIPSHTYDNTPERGF